MGKTGKRRLKIEEKKEVSGTKKVGGSGTGGRDFKLCFPIFVRSQKGSPNSESPFISPVTVPTRTYQQK